MVSFGFKACSVVIKRSNVCRSSWSYRVWTGGGPLKLFQGAWVDRRYFAVAAHSSLSIPQVEVSDATRGDLRSQCTPHLNTNRSLDADVHPTFSNALVSSHGDSLVQLTSITSNDFLKKISEQYGDGQYRHLVRGLIATPEVLYAAYVKITEMGRIGSAIDDVQMALDGVGPEWFIRTAKQLREGTFNVEENCQELIPRRAERSNQYVRVPNVKLKVVLEALRSVLQEIYEPQISNISHGSRNGRGRHTALRSIRSLSKGISWWITFDLHKKFDFENFRVLITALEETIKDRQFFDLLTQIHKSGILQLDIGGDAGEFSQENILSPVLLNIYFDKFDKEIGQIRKNLEAMNPKENCESQEFGTTWTGQIQKGKTMWCLEGAPEVKLVSCRYFDEILLAVVGPKKFALSIKNEVTTFLKSKLLVEVNPVRSILIHANSGKVKFLGVELQFVLVSKLPHVKTEKEIAALSKAKHRVKALAMQQRLHWENKLRKMGNKALTHIMKKATIPDSGNNKLVDKNVMDMFESMSREAVQQFMKTKEDREIWHEKLARGDALLSPLIRKQLPQELVDAYDEFQKKAAKYLGTPPSKVTLQEPRKVDPAKLAIEAFTMPDNKLQIYAPIDELIEKFRLRGIIDKGGRPAHLNVLLSQEDLAIIQWYSHLATALLDFFRCCDNFTSVKEKVDHHLRRSCLRTLAAKHKSTIYGVVTKFSDDLTSHFPTKAKLHSMGKTFLTDPKPYDDFLFLILTKISNQILRAETCAIAGCSGNNVDLYLLRIQKINPTSSSTSSKARLIHLGFDRRELPLCKEHYMLFCSGGINLQNIRISSLGGARETK